MNRIYASHGMILNIVVNIGDQKDFKCGGTNGITTWSLSFSAFHSHICY